MSKLLSTPFGLNLMSGSVDNFLVDRTKRKLASWYASGVQVAYFWESNHHEQHHTCVHFILSSSMARYCPSYQAYSEISQLFSMGW
jgi:hypothetical protein